MLKRAGKNRARLIRRNVWRFNNGVVQPQLARTSRCEWFGRLCLDRKAEFGLRRNGYGTKIMVFDWKSSVGPIGGRYRGKSGERERDR